MSRKIQGRYEKSRFYCSTKKARNCYAYAWIISCLAILNAYAKSYVHVEASGRVLKEYSFDSVCKSMTNNSSFLSRKLDNMNIKCLSTKVSASDFCRKEKPNFKESRLKELSRGVVLHNEDSVICEFVDSINVTVSCKSNLIKNECLFSKDSCLKIKKIYAADLKLFHHSNPTGAKVNCLFVKNDFFELNAL